MKAFSLSLWLPLCLSLFSGCFFQGSLEEERGFESLAQEPSLISMPAGLGEGQKDQLSKIFAQQGLRVTEDEAKAQYYFSRYEQKGRYQELYQEKSSDTYYLESLVTLDLCLQEKFSQKILLEKVYTQKQRIHPHEDFYSQRQWYQAEVQFESEQKIYAKIAQDLRRKLEAYEKS